MTSSAEPAESYPLEPAAPPGQGQSQGRVQRLSVEPVVRLPRSPQHPPQAQSQPMGPMRAQDYSSGEREWDRPLPSQPMPQPQAPILTAQPVQPKPRLDPKRLSPEEELARQAAVLGTLEAVSAILSARLLIFCAVAIGAALAFTVHDWLSAGVFGAWVSLTIPLLVYLDITARRRPSPGESNDA